MEKNEITGSRDGWVASNNLLIIADGGCTDQDYVDTHMFSRNLVTDIKINFDNNPSQNLEDVLQASLETNPCNGSSTICMAKLEKHIDEDNKIHNIL